MSDYPLTTTIRLRTKQEIVHSKPLPGEPGYNPNIPAEVIPVGHKRYITLSQGDRHEEFEISEEDFQKLSGFVYPTRQQPTSYEEAIKLIRKMSCPDGCGVGDKKNWGGYGNCAHEIARQICHRIEEEGRCPTCRGTGMASGPHAKCDDCDGTGRKKK